MSGFHRTATGIKKAEELGCSTAQRFRFDFSGEIILILFIFQIIEYCSRRRSFASLRMTGRGSVILSQRSDSVAPAKNLIASFPFHLLDAI